MPITATDQDWLDKIQYISYETLNLANLGRTRL